MKIITKKRHAEALEKEKAFWLKPDILEKQEFRTDRYLPPLKEVADAYGRKRIRRVLDVGCGPACLAKHIAEGEKYYLDPLLDMYRERFADVIPKKGKHLSCPIEEADLEKGTFDIVISLNAFDHVQDPFAALTAIRTLLKPEGVFLLSLYVRGAILAFLRNLQERLNLSTDSAHPYTFTKKGIEATLREAGFAIAWEKHIEHDRDRDEYVWKCVKGEE